MPFRFISNRLSVALVAAAVLLSFDASGADPSLRAAVGKGGGAHDPVILSFSSVGDSRQDPATADPTTLPLSAQDAIWLQNTRAFSRILAGVQQQNPYFLFFNGDMIMGYGRAGLPANNTTVAGIVGSDLFKTYQQYAFWRGMVAPLMEAGTYVVPVPGNHETQCKSCGKIALPENEDAWRANMGDLIIDNNRFVSLFSERPTNINVNNNAALDQLTSDQSKLSYSFDFRGTHFAIINTDPVGKDSHAPTNWLSSDLMAARLRGMQRIFVFGHKPAFTYVYGGTAAAPQPATPSGIDVDPAARDAFWSVIEQFDATYFCGHEHIFNTMQPWASRGGKAWQIMVGSGGSPFEAAPTLPTIAPATDRDYAWATVEVRRSGAVNLTAYGFDDEFGPTRVIKRIALHP